MRRTFAPFLRSRNFAYIRVPIYHGITTPPGCPRSAYPVTISGQPRRCPRPCPMPRPRRALALSRPQPCAASLCRPRSSCAPCRLPVPTAAPPVTISPDRCARPPQPFTRNEQQGQAVPRSPCRLLVPIAAPSSSSKPRTTSATLRPCAVPRPFLALTLSVRNRAPRPCAVLARPVRRPGCSSRLPRRLVRATVRRHDLARPLRRSPQPFTRNEQQGQAVPRSPFACPFRLPRTCAASDCRNPSPLRRAGCSSRLPRRPHRASRAGCPCRICLQ